MSNELMGKVAIVTGSGRGIGRAIAERFAASGAAVVITSRNAAQLDEVARSIEDKRGNAIAVTGDVRNNADIDRIINAAVSDFGGLDILVNNAATAGPGKPIVAMSDENWQTVLDTNLTAVFRFCRAAIPHLTERQEGRIINVAALSAKSSLPFVSADAAAKAGLLALTRILAAELGAAGITANAIIPGLIPDTELAKAFNSRMAEAFHSDTGKMLGRVKARTLLKRFPTTEEVAATALFLASSSSGAITGQDINICGGMDSF